MESNKKLSCFIFVVWVVLFFSAPSLAADCQLTCQKRVIENYFKLLAKVFQKGSTEKDIVNLFALFDPEVRYEHLDYEANFNKEEWLQAFTANLQRGAYQAAQNEVIRVTNIIFGKTHVAVEYKYGILAVDGSWGAKDNKGLFALFGFKDDKIVLLREYW